MKKFIGMSHVNRLDLTQKTIESLYKGNVDVVLLDNSGTGELKSKMSENDPVVLLPITFTFAQVQNYFIKIALSENMHWYGFMHDDAESDQVSEFIHFADKVFSENEKAGVVFSHYDTLCAIRTDTAIDVGWWDTNLPQYFSDNDFYRRVRLAGWKTIESNIPVVHHNGASNTVKADQWRLYTHQITFRLYESYYAQKWGGLADKETFSFAFNNYSLHTLEKNSIKTQIGK